MSVHDLVYFQRVSATIGVTLQRIRDDVLPTSAQRIRRGRESINRSIACQAEAPPLDHQDRKHDG